MEKILTVMNNLIPHDKLLHFFYGTMLFIVLVMFLGIFYNLEKTFLFACMYVVIAATGKEVYDYLHKDKHTPDYKDIIFTSLTAILLTFYIYLFRG